MRKFMLNNQLTRCPLTVFYLRTKPSPAFVPKPKKPERKRLCAKRVNKHEEPNLPFLRY